MSGAFEELKKSLTTPPVLAFPEFGRPFVVETDASEVALCAILAQKKDDEKVHPVHYANRTVNDAECRYSACETEALTVTFSLKKFRLHLLSSDPFVAAYRFSS